MGGDGGLVFGGFSLVGWLLVLVFCFVFLKCKRLQGQMTGSKISNINNSIFSF